MLQEPFFADKQILIIDQDTATPQHRTWCFWEQGEGLFEPIVLHSWKQIDFFGPSFSKRYDIEPYRYKMIRSAHLHQYVHIMSTPHKNVHWLNAPVQSVGNEPGQAFVLAGGEKIFGRYLFNSIQLSELPRQKNRHYLLQHFKGRMIETLNPVFDETIARLMDFRTNQQHGASFFYVLPLSPQQALVEYTLFSPAMLQPHEYDAALDNYISEILNISKYQILETETGAIPMTSHRFTRRRQNVFHIGTAGGDTKPSTGYTFQFIQKRTAQIVEALVKEQVPDESSSLLNRRFPLYDSTLLRVLAHHKMPGDKLFTRLFANSTPQQIFRFLDNESSLKGDLPILASLPTSVFLPAFVKEIFR